MMDADERDVYLHLKTQSESQFIPAQSICRHAGGKHRFRESPDWAKPALLRMLERGIVEVNPVGAYRLKPFPQAKVATQRWVSPQIAAILKQSGRNFELSTKSGSDADAYYNNL